jgi:acyl-CoA oxidase
MLSTLVGGRISVGGGATSAAKVGLTIAIRYASQRRQFPDARGREKRILSYLTHQRRLMPRLAAAYAYSFGQHELVRRSSKRGASEHEAREAETLAAGFKALSTWQAIDTLQQCRECCGGQGYLSASRIDALRTDSDVFTTFEGDNTVLLQLVANNLLRAFGRARAEQPIRAAVRTVVSEAVEAVSLRHPIAELRDGGEAELRLPEVHAALMRAREQALLDSLARRVNRRIRDGADPQDALEACQDHAVALGRAHIEQFVLTSFHEAAKTEPLLAPLSTLYGAWRIESDLAWFLEQELLSPAQTRLVRKLVNQLSRDLTPLSLDLVEAFGIPTSCLGPLADREYVHTSGLAAQ